MNPYCQILYSLQQRKRETKPCRTHASCHPDTCDAQPTHLLQAGKPQPKPTNKYIRKMTTTTSSTMTRTFFHHICRLSPLLRTLKSRALPPSRSVLSTS